MSKTFTTGYSVNMIVQFGKWIFHFRNFLFPVFYIALFIPSQRVFNSQEFSDIFGLTFIFSGILVRTITIGLVYIVRGGKTGRYTLKNL